MDSQENELIIFQCEDERSHRHHCITTTSPRKPYCEKQPIRELQSLLLCKIFDFSMVAAAEAHGSWSWAIEEIEEIQTVSEQVEQIHVKVKEVDCEASLCVRKQMASWCLESSSLPFNHLTGLDPTPQPLTPPSPGSPAIFRRHARSMCQCRPVNLCIEGQ